MGAKNLQELLDNAGNTVELLRNSQLGSYVYPVVAYEFTNWQTEVRAWAKTSVLYDQTHHMDNLFIRGRDALKLISDTAINSVANFPIDKAKQYVPTTPAGFVIGDGILFHEAEDEYTYVGRAPVSDWLLFQGETGGYDVEVVRDRPLPDAPDGQGRHPPVLPVPDSGPDRVAGHREVERRPGRAAQVLQHELHEHRRHEGPYAAARHGRRPRCGDLGPLRGLRPDSHRDLGSGRRVRPVGRRLSRLLVEHPRVGLDPVAVARHLHRRRLRPYREWLGADSYEATNAIAGSFVSDNIEDYYSTPWNLGYGSFIKYDHDFIGRDALEKVDPTTQRKKITLAWNGEDMAKITGSLFDREGESYKFFDLPNANYGSSNFDSIIDPSGKVVGLSMFTGYSANEGPHCLSASSTRRSSWAPK